MGGSRATNLFKRITDVQSYSRDFFGLAKTMNPRESLFFQCGVPAVRGTLVKIYARSLALVKGRPSEKQEEKFFHRPVRFHKVCARRNGQGQSGTN